jgi:transglutaminase/protease-like cytokinesis protein 3
MAAKSRFNSPANSPKRTLKITNGFIGAILGAALLLSVNNIRDAFNIFENQQLISLASASTSSSQYQPIQLGVSDKITQHDFREIDRLAKQLNYSGSSVTELAELLEQNAATELDKARIIYAWITQHITYDVPAFLDAVNNDRYPDVNPAKILRDRTTICSGYSNLYYALAEAMNLESAIVVGYAKGATPEEDPRFQDINHAWNTVRIDGAWYLLDATFGAGSVREEKFVPEYKPYYFGTSPKQFIGNHYPQDRGWQLLAQEYTRTEFDNLANVSSRFYNLGLETVSHHSYKIYTSNRLDLKLKAPKNVVAIAELTQNNQDLSSNTILVNRQSENIVVGVAPPSAGTYDLTIYAKQKDDLGDYGEVIKYQIEATNSTAQLPKIYGHFHQSQASLIEPLSAELASNWSTYFNLVVPEAIDVQVINNNAKQWTPLNKYGNYFAGNVEIKSGSTAVVAKFPGNDQYWQLVEYQAK